jgi:hypothetical protein
MDGARFGASRFRKDLSMFADKIRECVGSETDEIWNFPFAGIVNDIARSERFVLTDEVVEAAKRLLESKPSSLLNALSLCRVPFEHLWLEWRGEHAPGLDRTAPTREGAKPVDKMGVYIRANNKGRNGIASWIWSAPDGSISFSGMSIAFNIEGDMEALYKQFGVDRPKTDRDSVRDFLKNHSHDWGKLTRNSDVEAEAIVELSMHTAPFPCLWAANFFKKLESLGVSPKSPEYEALLDSWTKDVSGEFTFMIAVLMLINTRNGVEHLPTDLSRLNKARAKSRKPPKFEHSITHLKLSRGQRRIGDARGMDREAMRQHLVRGHFKIRKTGVYWWSPFVRGDASRPLARNRYEVEQ